MKDSIIVYSSPTCPKCKLLKKELGKRNISFTENQDEQVMLAKNITTLPALEIDGKVMTFVEAWNWLQETK